MPRRARDHSSEKRKVGSVRPLIILGIVVIIWWMLPPFIKSGARSVTKELQAPLWTGVSYLKDLDLYWSLKTESKDNLIEIIRDLARENAALSLQKQESANAQTQLAHLESILRIPSLPGFDYRVARVYRRDTTAWWDRMVIGFGERDGAKEGMGVVSADGVVGRIVEVMLSTCVVELVSSPLFRVAATFVGDTRPLTYQGKTTAPFDLPIGQVKNVPTDIKATTWEPRRLVSSRLGGVFPDGLTIGWVRELKTESDGLFQSGSVYLPESLFDLSEISVLIPHETQEG